MLETMFLLVHNFLMILSSTDYPPGWGESASVRSKNVLQSPKTGQFEPVVPNIFAPLTG